MTEPVTSTFVEDVTDSETAVRRSDFVDRSVTASWTWWIPASDWMTRFVMAWVIGSCVWLGLQMMRAMRFQRRVHRDSAECAEWQHQAEVLAAEFGVRGCPQVLILDAAISPMLWGCGRRTKLLFPAELAERLAEDARATLLAHELAHYARGDHWVRVLELITTGLFWWHPVVWLAKHQIEEAEEECCDAWVVGEFPHAPRKYAEALLDTIDFLCESRRPLPPIASGLGQSHFLRRRLIKIMQGVAPKSLSSRARGAITLVAALLLPLQPFVFASPDISKLQLPTFDSLSMVSSASVNASRSSTANDADASAALQVDASSPTVKSPGTRAPVTRSRMPGEKVWSTAASTDGRFVIRTTTARKVILTDLSTNAETDLTPRVTAVSFAPEGDWFAAAHQDGRVTIWNAASGELSRTLLSHSDVLRSVAVNAQSNLIAVGGRDGAVLVIDVVTGQSRTDFPTFSSAVNCVRFSPDGRQLAVAVGDWTSDGRGEIVLLNANDGQVVTTLACATSPGALTFVSNDELIAGLWDGRTQLWNLVNRQVVGSAQADKNVVSAAAFSPDNPALREALFIAEETNRSEKASPFTMLRGLFAAPNELAK